MIIERNNAAINLYEQRMKTGVLLLLNCPELMIFGIDTSSWKIGDKFMGIKNIPDGAHYIYYSLRDEEYAVKQSLFIHVSEETKVHVRKWDSEIQDFLVLKEEDEKNFTIGVNNLEFDAFLGPYPLEKMEDWKDLCKYVTQELLDKLEPLTKKYITSSKEYQDTSQTVKANIYFTSIPKKKFIHKSEAECLTKNNIDKSLAVEELLKNEYNNNPSLLLGEFQYAFITFFLGEVYESFEQWKSIFILLFSCQELITKAEQFYSSLIEVVYHQMRNLPKDFFIDEISSNNFIKNIMESFITNINNGSYPVGLRKRIELFQIFLKQQFDFEVRDENTKIINQYLNNNQYGKDEDDELPVIVDEKEIEQLNIYHQNIEINENTIGSSYGDYSDMN